MQYLYYDSPEKSELAMKQTWEEFRKQISDIDYTDIKISDAIHDYNFLSHFHDIFHNHNYNQGLIVEEILETPASGEVIS